MLHETPFEIITAGGNRFRYEGPNRFWQYGLIESTLDQEDKTIVEVFKVTEDEDEESIILRVFSQVISAGCVDDDTLLAMPREKLIKQCPRCGFCEFKDS